MFRNEGLLSRVVKLTENFASILKYCKYDIAHKKSKNITYKNLFLLKW